jgi:hypothetical protein
MMLIEKESVNKRCWLSILPEKKSKMRNLDFSEKWQNLQIFGVCQQKIDSFLNFC